MSMHGTKSTVMLLPCYYHFNNGLSVMSDTCWGSCVLLCWKRSRKHPKNHPDWKKIKTQHKQTAEVTNHDGSKGVMDIRQKGQGLTSPFCSDDPMMSTRSSETSALHFLLESGINHNGYCQCLAPLKDTARLHWNIPFHQWEATSGQNTWNAVDCGCLQSCVLTTHTQEHSVACIWQHLVWPTWEWNSCCDV